MRAEIIKLRQRIDTIFVYVTHDQTEAMTLGDRIVIMRDGFIHQIGTPQEVFDHPANLFVAGFIGTHSEGSMGMLEVLPEFRRKGYGLALEQFLIAWHLSRGWTPFGHVIDGNEPSLRLQQKAGMVCAGLPAIWLF